MKGKKHMKKFAFAALALVMLLACCAGVAENAALNVGDHFFLGSYEQDNDLTNGQEPIEWRVLQIENGEMLAIAEYALDSQPYNNKGGHARWNKASLRTWLSTEFYNTAFADAEKQLIITKELKNWEEKNSCAGPGNGKKNSAARSQSSAASWVTPVTGKENASQWMKAAAKPSTISSYSCTKKV